MSKKRIAKTIGAFDFMGTFPTEAFAREHLEGLRWKNGIDRIGDLCLGTIGKRLTYRGLAK
jgi:hypothetical protein